MMQMLRLTRACVLLAACALSGPALAENWIEIAASADGKVRQYLDIDSIERNLGSVEMWRVLDYAQKPAPEISGKAYASQRIHLEFDCAARSMRQSYVGWHAAPSGKGALLREGADSEWQIDAFDELTLPLWKIACEGLSLSRKP